MKKFLLFLLISILVLTGCGDIEDPVGKEMNKAEVQDSDAVKIVASEKSLPDAFHELSFQREEVPHFNYLVRLADNQVSFEEEWKLFNLSEVMPKVDFDSKSVIFLA